MPIETLVTFQKRDLSIIHYTLIIADEGLETETFLLLIEQISCLSKTCS